MGKPQFYPWDELAPLFEAADRLAGRFRRAAPRPNVPPADVLETEAEYVLEIDLPGMDREDVQLSARPGELTVSGCRPRPAQCSAYLALERDCGPFARTFVLPADADTETIQAVLRHGVLTIRLAKGRTVSRRSIDLE